MAGVSTVSNYGLSTVRKKSVYPTKCVTSNIIVVKFG